ncbi:hypothetical protein VDGD_01395 [Verticillium dahliae]|nr:hypothetical protein VDGD_01395 [Verticillium dahliae]
MPRSSRVIGSELKTSNRRLRSSGRTATRPPTNNQAEARPQTCAASTDDSLARTILSQHLGKSDDPRGHEQGNRSPPGSPSMPSRPGELPIETDSVRSADYDPEQIDSQGSEEGDFWPIVGIVKERRRNKKLSYLVRWASDPQTGQEFPLQWISAEGVTEAAIEEWESEKAQAQDQKTRARKTTTTNKSTSRTSVVATAATTTAETPIASPQSVDSSQEVLPANRRKRPRPLDSRARSSSVADFLPGLTADDVRASKRPRLSVDLSSLPSSEAYTPEASDNFERPNTSSIFVELPSKAAIDTSQYHSFPESSQQTANSHSQSLSALEELDAQITLEPAFQSQETIPDSQDWLDDTQTGSSSQALSVSQTVPRPRFEVPDSQKDSSLEKSIVPSQSLVDPSTGDASRTLDPEIPSHQPDIEDTREQADEQHSSLNELVEESHKPASPKFFSQPDFGFDLELIASSTLDSREVVPESSSGAPLPLTQPQEQLESAGSHALTVVEVPQSQDVLTEQAAQIDPAQASIAVSQVTCDSSSPDNVVPDLVVRRAICSDPETSSSRPANSSKMSGVAPDEDDPVALLLDAAAGQQNAESSAPISEFPDVNDLFDFIGSSNRTKLPAEDVNQEMTDSGETETILPGAVPVANDILLSAPEPASLPLMPVMAELQGAVNESDLEIATSTDMSGALLQPEPVPEVFPATISPSEISRTIEPESLMQGPLEPPTMSIEAVDPEITSSPSSEVPVSGQYLVTLPLPANMKEVYLNTILRYRREIEAFNNQQSNEGTPPDAQLSAQIDRFFGDLFDICDHPASLGADELRQLDTTDIQKHAMGTNSKFYFVGRLLERLAYTDKKVLIIARSQKLLGYLQAIIGTINPSDREESELVVQLAHAEQDVDALAFDIVIGYDSAYAASVASQQVEQAEPSKKPVVISLVITYSIEHFEVVIPTDFGDLDRKNALLISIFQSRAVLANHGDQDVERVVAEFAEHLRDPDLAFDWEPELIPSDLLDFYDNAQKSQTQPQSQLEARQISALKRKHDGPPVGSPKRLRRSQSVAQTPAELDSTVRELIDPDPAKEQVMLTRAAWGALTQKNTELESQLRDKDELEAITRKQITRMSKQIKSHESTANVIQKQHMAALSERAGFEKERNQAVEQEQAVRARLAERDATILALQARLEQAASKDSVLAGLDEKSKELSAAREEIRLLEKKLKSKESDFDFARGQYQDERQHVNDTMQENKELREQVAQLKQQFSESLVKIQKINADSSQKDLQRLVVEAQTLAKDRERELERTREELRSLKNGRRETRGTSVPRSPRMGVMTPRNGRGGLSTLGASAGATPGSRGTSPSHVVETPAPPPPPPLFAASSAANGRFNHLRDRL